MARVTARSAWIEGPGFDLAAFFAPALLGLAAFAAVAALGASPLLLLWLWIVAFDGPHMLAAYSRAYGDPALWRTRKWLLIGSLGAFLVGPALVAMGSGLGADWPFSAFLLLMTFYSYHHVVRQHWGFAALYAARGASPLPRARRHLLYLSCWCPYFAFLLTHPSLRQLAGPELSVNAAAVASSLAWVCIATWALTLLCALGLVQRARRAGQPTQSTAYLALTALFHGLVYLGLARAEPLFPAAQNLDQTFMMLAVVGGVFHSAQYVALIALFHVRSSQTPALAPTWFGRSWQRLLLVAVPFLALYAGVACLTNVYPSCSLGFSGETSRWALALWWGFALHHYWLDERIWHVRSDKRLRAIFQLSA